MYDHAGGSRFNSQDMWWQTLYQSGKISGIDNIRYELCRGVADIQVWCSSRQLQLNALKTELHWFNCRANLHKLSSADLTLSVGNDVIQPVAVVRDLGVYFDAPLLKKQHISRIVSSCFFQLRQIRRSTGEEITKRLAMALVFSWLGLLQRCTRRPSWVDHQTVAACTECRCSSHHKHQPKRPYHSSFYAFTVDADKIADYLQTVIWLHGWDCSAHCGFLGPFWPPVCQSPPVPEASAEVQVRLASHQSCRLNSLPDYIQSVLNTKCFKKLLNTFCLHRRFNFVSLVVICNVQLGYLLYRWTYTMMMMMMMMMMRWPKLRFQTVCVCYIAYVV